MSVTLWAPDTFVSIFTGTKIRAGTVSSSGATIYFFTGNCKDKEVREVRHDAMKWSCKKKEERKGRESNTEQTEVGNKPVEQSRDPLNPLSQSQVFTSIQLPCLEQLFTASQVTETTKTCWVLNFSRAKKWEKFLRRLQAMRISLRFLSARRRLENRRTNKVSYERGRWTVGWKEILVWRK